MLTAVEQKRYSRHLLLGSVGEQGQLKLKQATVLIVGAGGLGNPVAAYLAAAGVGRLIIADGDSVELSNLQRQILFSMAQIGENKADAMAARLAELNDDIDIEIVDDMLDGEQLSYWAEQADVIVDCTDNLAIRHQINQTAVAAAIPLVIGAAIRSEGQLMIVDKRVPASACYQCLYPTGHEVELNCQTAGVLGPVLGIVGSTQALMTIKILLGQTVQTNQLSLFDGDTGQWRYLRLSPNPTCSACCQ